MIITDEEDTQFGISLFRYGLAVDNRILTLYTLGVMLIGGIITLMAVMI